ncbi:Ppx/GppA phosphatase family protein [Salinibacter altiplanensis]|uniref:Ppx/GppA phosphatase family protein n=1 Tax=Salinibacter altiplanensis TaxID=1803181 RepID=UPI000C9F7F3B|nr:Ppx/GppA phosphatase family protein [Salinibacter altiplanensis]
MSASHERAACTLLPETTYGATEAASPVRVCVIDLGTNSFHAIIVDAHPNGSYQVVDRLKEMVRLGEHGLDANRLPEDAMARGLDALTRIKLLADGWDTREYLAFATSAIREASNGGTFIERAREELGLRIRPISGEQEARLIFQGVSRTEEFTEPTLVMDIGGGSVEFIVVDDDTPVYSTSLKLGAARMTEQFVTTDPMSEDEQARLRAHFKGMLEGVVTACREHGVGRVVGSSGTMKSLARVTLAQADIPDRSPFQAAFPIPDVRSSLRGVMQATAEERRTHPAIEPRRVDQIGAGAVLLDTVCAGLPSLRHFAVSPNALREGMVVHFLDANYDRLQRMAPFRDPRRRSVHEMAYRFQWEEEHAQHVAATATFLFDVCRPLYDGPASDVELLEYAALLHDVGYLVTHDKHHEHSRYLIEHADLQGFRAEEVAIMALVARYHRGAAPAPSHERYGRLPPRRRRRVRQLAALLRVAENLDRSHFQNVVALRTSLTDAALHVLAATKADPQLEVWAAEEHGALFEEAFDRALHVAPTEIPVHANGQRAVSQIPEHSLRA